MISRSLTLAARLQACVLAGAMGVIAEVGDARVSQLSALPATLTFAASDPDAVAAPGSTVAVVSWRVQQSRQSSWTLSVSAAGATFAGCGWAPASAVEVTCTGVTAMGGGSGSCAAPLRLSAAPQQIAAGVQMQNDMLYVAIISLRFFDSWRYIAASSPACSLSITYTVNAH
jgi:hypothetical protein